MFISFQRGGVCAREWDVREWLRWTLYGASHFYFQKVPQAPVVWDEHKMVDAFSLPATIYLLQSMMKREKISNMTLHMTFDLTDWPPHQSFNRTSKRC